MAIRLNKQQVIYNFSKEHPPALIVENGATIQVETADCFTDQIDSANYAFSGLNWDQINPATGPIFVKGAEPGDVLKVKIKKIELDSMATMITGPDMGVLGSELTQTTIKKCPIKNDFVQLTSTLKVKVNKMIGVIGTAPKDEAISCGTPDAHGGNMDCKDEEIKHLNLLKNKRVDGIIITSKANSWDVLNDYAKYGSIVTCEETPLQTISAAYTDRLRSYLEVFHYLKKRGHTNVAFTSVRSAEKSNSTKSVLVAYEQVFAPPLEKNYRTNCFTYEDGLRAGEYFLNQANPPTAIYANGDEIAAGIYHVAIEKGLRIPNDLVLIGEEYLPVGKVLELSSMDHQLELLGQVAFELAIQQRIKKKKIPHILRCAPN
ncbi:substrate-binding domain-containing protein [Carnobacterium maltaromaticum]|nr:substrate-binding domain-containing protein [Carnobacterium maltaromaticum]